MSRFWGSSGGYRSYWWDYWSSEKKETKKEKDEDDYDWRTAYRACRRSDRDTVSRNHMYEYESFFRSNWFKTLTNGNIDGKWLVQALKKQEDEKWNKLHKQT